MSEFKGVVRTGLVAAGGALTWLLGAWDAFLLLLLCFMGIDYVSGVFVAIVQRELSSKAGFTGLLKKGAMLLVVAVAAQLDKLSGTGAFRSMACSFYAANEGISILENARALGIPLPAALVRALERMQKENDGGGPNPA